MSLVFNERIRLTASWLNTLATAVVAAGVFAPLAAAFYGLSAMAIDRYLVTVLICGCLSGGAGLHLIGLLLLGRLRE